jgi:hypothetical protein
MPPLKSVLNSYSKNIHVSPVFKEGFIKDKKYG